MGLSRLSDLPSIRATWNVPYFLLIKVPQCSTINANETKHQKTLELIFSRPVSANIKWQDIEGLFRELGAELAEREGSRIEVFLFDEIRVYHRPHPRPDTDKGAVASIREWLKGNEVTP